MPSRSKYIATLALLTTAAVIMGYVEMLIPLDFIVPGVKLGLCNIVILMALCLYSFKEALLISICRILITGFLFGNAFGIFYSLGGTLSAILVMTLLLLSRRFGFIGISASGGAAFGLGQLAVARLLLPGLPFAHYAAILIFTGMITGALTGALAYIILKRISSDDALPRTLS